ncbi:protein mono-ADP-ribosyltransferase PARP11-like [Gouania willdenowi]|nr:protein mono-ADP-ribosyltransferase PARP11-like [Gouania willdenowi]
MDTSETQFYWYFLADCQRWHRFEDHPINPFRSEELEQLYLRNTCHLNIGSFIGIDFSAMKHTDFSTGKERSIKRSPVIIDKSCSCFTAAPVFWEELDPTRSYQLIPLTNQSDEYQTVEKFTKNERLLNNDILSIKRIQNLDLWEFYCRKKIQLMKIHQVKHIEERRLFHGTSTENMDSICKYNFDLRLAGKNGNVYGKGIYFAEYASYADRYSREGKLPGASWGFSTKVMFLARVIVGKSTLGHRHFIKPDDGNDYQSSVDDMTNSKIFVIFDPNQIYPEYLIEYL